MISVDNVTVERDERVALADISLTVSERRVGIIGLNGSGKSTLVRLFNGLVLPTSGSVTSYGLDTAKEAKLVRQKVGFVFQNPENQIIMPLVKDDIAFGLKNLRLGKDVVRQRTGEALERLSIGHLGERESHSLSGGEKQMVALAGVLAMGPATIIFDEPTTMLDLKNRRLLFAQIESLEQQAIVVTHDLDMLTDFERVLVIDQGRLAFDGTPDDALGFYTETCCAL